MRVIGETIYSMVKVLKHGLIRASMREIMNMAVSMVLVHIYGTMAASILVIGGKIK